MSVRPILRWPDERLSKKCDPVQEITDEICDLADDMLATMYAAPGRGLAAPQVGVLKRMFVMDAIWKDGADRAPQVFVNPEIIAASSDNAEREEGCLSIPGVTVSVTRPAEVEVKWQDLTGNQHQVQFDGFAAACVQHEIDHLDGIVTFDRLEEVSRARAIKAYSEVPE